VFKDNKSNTDSNFWISYADLMAGLLFVFILLIGAIVSKSMTLREDLANKKETLDKTVKTLKAKENNLQKLNITVKNKDKTIQEQLATITLQSDEIVKLKSFLSNREKDLNNTKNSLILTQNELKLKSNELKKLNQLLLAKNTNIDSLNGKVVILQNLLEDRNKTINSLKSYKDKVIVLSNSLTKKENELNITQEKMLTLLDSLDKKQSSYEKILKELQDKREKIKYLTGIRLRIIEELKSSLGKSINVTKDGSLKLSSNILFDKGSSELKVGAKEQLKSYFTKYINTLFENKSIAPNIDTIVIEGHTDSDGGYLFNLKLSQDRALSVMSYLLTLDVSKKYNLQKMLTASGRSYLDRVLQDNTEDKEASRRIEFKFRLKNQNALYEIEKILDEN